MFLLYLILVSFRQYAASSLKTGFYCVFFHIQDLADIGSVKSFHIIKKKDTSVFFIQRSQKLVPFTGFKILFVKRSIRNLIGVQSKFLSVQDILAFVDKNPCEPCFKVLVVF